MFSGFKRISYLRDMETELDKAKMLNEDKIGSICRRYNYRGRLTPEGVYGFVVDRCREIAEWKDQQPATEVQFKQYVLQELSAAGYFMADCDQKLMKHNNPDWKPYSGKSFGEMLLDFACQWNMEHEGKNYKYILNETY